MLLLHTADLHLDSPLTTHLDGERVIRRRRELDETLARLLSDGVRRGIGGVLIVGDLYDTRRVRQASVTRVLELVRHYAPLPFFYVSGNHEGDVLTARTDLPKNLTVLAADSATVQLGNVCLRGVESPRALCAMEPLPTDTYNIVLLHAAVGERTDGETLAPADIREKNIDYLALGHYHTYTVYTVGERTRAVYPGAPEGRGYDELGPRGYVLLDTDSGCFEPVCTARRRIWDESVDISSCESVRDVVSATEKALRAVGAVPDDLVRVTLTGRLSPGALRDRAEAVHAALDTAYFSFDLRDEVRLLLRAADFAADPTLKGEFVRMLMEDEGLEERLRERIIDCGLLYLQESDGGL